MVNFGRILSVKTTAQHTSPPKKQMRPAIFRAGSNQAFGTRIPLFFLNQVGIESERESTKMNEGSPLINKSAMWSQETASN